MFPSCLCSLHATVLSFLSPFLPSSIKFGDHRTVTEATFTIHLTCTRCISIFEPRCNLHRLVRVSNQSSLYEKVELNCPGPAVLGLIPLPWAPTKFMVRTSDGRLLHLSRFGSAGPPREYTCGTQIEPSRVTSIDCSQLTSGYFVVGCENGSIRLYHQKVSYPLDTWSSQCVQSRAQTKDTFTQPSIVQVQWSPRRASMFFALDSASYFHIFDLLRNDKAPVLSERVPGSIGLLPSTHAMFGIGVSPGFPLFAAISVGTKVHAFHLDPELANEEHSGNRKFLDYLASI